MTVTQLMADLTRLGIRLEAEGNRLRYWPRSAVTTDLAQRMKARKGELLAILRHDTEAPAIDLTDAMAVWQAALDRLETPSRYAEGVVDYTPPDGSYNAMQRTKPDMIQRTTLNPSRLAPMVGRWTQSPPTIYSPVRNAERWNCGRPGWATAVVRGATLR